MTTAVSVDGTYIKQWLHIRIFLIRLTYALTSGKFCFNHLPSTCCIAFKARMVAKHAAQLGTNCVPAELSSFFCNPHLTFWPCYMGPVQTDCYKCGGHKLQSSYKIWQTHLKGHEKHTYGYMTEIQGGSPDQHNMVLLPLLWVVGLSQISRSDDHTLQTHMQAHDRHTSINIYLTNKLAGMW